jgi:hypothetical protein
VLSDRRQAEAFEQQSRLGGQSAQHTGGSALHRGPYRQRVVGVQVADEAEDPLEPVDEGLHSAGPATIEHTASSAIRASGRRHNASS